MGNNVPFNLETTQACVPMHILPFFFPFRLEKSLELADITS